MIQVMTTLTLWRMCFTFLILPSTSLVSRNSPNNFKIIWVPASPLFVMNLVFSGTITNTLVQLHIQRQTCPRCQLMTDSSCMHCVLGLFINEYWLPSFIAIALVSPLIWRKSSCPNLSIHLTCGLTWPNHYFTLARPSYIPRKAAPRFSKVLSICISDCSQMSICIRTTAGDEVTTTRECLHKPDNPDIGHIPASIPQFCSAANDLMDEQLKEISNPVSLSPLQEEWLHL